MGKYEHTAYERAELKRALLIEGFDLWRKLGITKSMADDIAERILKQGRFMLTASGELIGDDIALAVEDIKANKDNAFLFEPTEALDPKPSAEPTLQRLTAEQRLQRANEQFFADRRRAGKGV